MYGRSTPVARLESGHGRDLVGGDGRVAGGFFRLPAPLAGASGCGEAREVAAFVGDRAGFGSFRKTGD